MSNACWSISVWSPEYERAKVLSSTNLKFETSEHLSPFISITNSLGPRTVPCGTPQVMVRNSDFSPKIFVLWDLSLRKEISNFMILFLT